MGFRSWRVWLQCLCFASLMLLVFSVAGWAKVTTAAISGQIEDTCEADVSEAKVTVKDMETGATRVVTTDTTGSYRGHTYASNIRLGVQAKRRRKALPNERWAKPWKRLRRI